MKKLYILFLLFFLTPAFALVTEDVPNGCTSYTTKALAFFDTDQYTCANGTFLPASGVACASCPDIATCSGGTYTYNATTSQGIVFNSTVFTTNQANSCAANIDSPRAVFSVDYYNCTNNQFLPASGVACASCPTNANCSGGFFLYNDTKTQGITMPDMITGNMSNVCLNDLLLSTNNTATPRAVFQTNAYNCAAGTYLPANGLNCVICPANHWCPGGLYLFNATNDQGITACESGWLAVEGSSQCRQDLTQCSSGYYLPANSRTCTVCPSGGICNGGVWFFDENKVQGIELPIIINQSVKYACSTDNLQTNNNNSSIIHAIFQTDYYNCSAGTYLPVDGIACVTCPANSYCTGGTYTYNPTTAAGIVACDAGLTSPAGSSSVSDCVANQVTCAGGTYLAAGASACTTCPENSYCAGGTYTYSDTTSHGITACSAGLYAPAGMWAANQCGHILHIGDEVVYLHGVKKTSPSLHVKIGDDIFYGNMTTADVVMHAGTSHKLKVQYNNATYSIYDDTVNVNQ